MQEASHTAKAPLLGLTPEQLKKVVAEAGLPAFTAKQMASWLYAKRVRSIDEMTNLSKAARAWLSEHYEVGLIPYAECFTSRDGTKKYLFPVAEGEMVERMQDGLPVLYDRTGRVARQSVRRSHSLPIFRRG